MTITFVSTLCHKSYGSVYVTVLPYSILIGVKIMSNSINSTVTTGNWYELDKDPLVTKGRIYFKGLPIHNSGYKIRRYEPVVKIGNRRIASEQHTVLPKHYDDVAFMNADTTGNVPKETIYITKDKIKWYSNHIAGKVCAKCGEPTRCCLGYHHINPKTKVSKDRSISIMIRNKDVSISDIINEISLCVLLCRNCHTKVHTGIITIQ